MPKGAFDYVKKDISRDGAFARVLKLELKRSLCSIRFLLAILMMLVWLCLNAYEAVKTYDHAVFAGVPILIRLGMDGQMSTGPVILSIAAVPYAFSYLSELECGFCQQYIQRVGVTVYGTSKAIATAVSAFLMGALALGGFIAFLSAIGIPHSVRFDEVQYTYAVLTATRGPGWFYAIMILKTGLVCSQAAVFALMIMAWVHNAYVGFFSPIIGYYFITCVCSILSRIMYAPLLWRLVNISFLFFGQAADNLLFGYLWSVIFLIITALFFGISFAYQLETEGNG